MVLPEGLKFLHLGWWVIHSLGVWLVWSYAYRKGRADERKALRSKVGGIASATPGATTPS